MKTSDIIDKVVTLLYMSDDEQTTLEEKRKYLQRILKMLKILVERSKYENKK